MEFPYHKEGQLDSRMLTSTLMILDDSGKLYFRRSICVFLKIGGTPNPIGFPIWNMTVPHFKNLDFMVICDDNH